MCAISRHGWNRHEGTALEKQISGMDADVPPRIRRALRRSETSTLGAAQDQLVREKSERLDAI